MSQVRAYCVFDSGARATWKCGLICKVYRSVHLRTTSILRHRLCLDVVCCSNNSQPDERNSATINFRARCGNERGPARARRACFGCFRRLPACVRSRAAQGTQVLPTATTDRPTDHTTHGAAQAERWLSLTGLTPSPTNGPTDGQTNGRCPRRPPAGRARTDADHARTLFRLEAPGASTGRRPYYVLSPSAAGAAADGASTWISSRLAARSNARYETRRETSSKSIGRADAAANGSGMQLSYGRTAHA